MCFECTKDMNFATVIVYEPRSEKTGVRDFRPGPTQTRLYYKTTEDG